jgi:hypothetical protein
VSGAVCNYNRCLVPPTVASVDENGHVDEDLCIGHAVKAARDRAARLQYLDVWTGKPVLRVVVEVFVEVLVDDRITT